MADRMHEELRRLFDRVYAAPQAERAGILHRECGGDSELRRRLEAMVAAAEGDRFLAAPTGAEQGPPSKAPAPLSDSLGESSGTLIGPYKLLQQIGEGGFGAVFMAEQEEPVRRRVALKILKLGMDTRQVVARFEQERQALAMMDHPNIARVIDAGATESGRPYFVMDLVKGESISVYCDTNRLSIDERLELFAQVCNAVQHAHQKGIIHRDLKPSNILVSTQDGRPTAKVIDFGIAKATSAKLTDKTLFTEHQQVIGTLQYMSPEQAEGSLDIDTRTDVYSLGVVLYELLTGSTPFDAKTLREAFYSEVQRMIREVEPPKPSTRLHQSADTLAGIAARRGVEPQRLGTIVRGELDWIVMKALEKDRARRYESASGLAADVRNYLGGEAVVAAPPSAAYRLRKFVLRNRVTVTAGAAVAVALLIGVIAFAWQAKIARVQRDRALTAEGETQKRADELQKVSDFQAGMLGQIDPTEAGVKLMQGIRRKHASAMEETHVPETERAARAESFAQELSRVNATDTAVATIESTILLPAVEAIAQRFDDQPIVAATLRQTLASLHTKLGRYDEALPLQQFALDTRRRALGDEHADTLFSINDMATLLQKQGRYAEAEPMFRAVLEGQRRLRGADHGDTLSAMGNLGGNLRHQGKFAEAEPLVREALSRSRRVRGDEHRDTLFQLNVLGYLLIDQGKPAEAEPYWREYYEKSRRALGEDDPETLTATNNLGGLMDAMGRPAEAEKYYSEALAVARRVHGEEHPTTLICASNVGSNLQAQGRYAEAEPLFREALEVRLRVLGEEHPDTLSSMHSLGLLLSYQGKLSEAERFLRTSLEVRRRVRGNEHPDTLRSAVMLAALLGSMGDSAQAETLYREVLEAPRTVWGDDHPDRLIAMNNLGNLLSQEKRSAEAEPLLRQAFDARRRVSGDEHPETLIAQTNVARLLEDQGQLEEAEAMYRDATEKFRKVLGNDHPNTLNSIGYIGRILLVQGRFAEAEPYYREAVTGLERALGPGHATVANVRRGLGRALTGLNRFAEAQTELVEAHRVLSTTQGVAPDRLQACVESLIALYEAWEKAEPGKGHDAEAERWRDGVR